MRNMFFIMPVLICLYEICSLILPLKISLWSKVLASIILLAGLLKIFMYRRTSSGFDMTELPYYANVLVSVIFNFIIVALFILLVKDIAFIILRIILRFKFPSHYASLAVLILALCSTLYGTYEGMRVPDVNTHEVKIAGLAKEFDGMRIAMLVDIHASNLNNREFVQAIVNKTNALNPDLILMPGDFVDGQVKTRYADVEPLKTLRAKYGVYASTGNHEYYFDFTGWMRQLKEFGINFLENEHVIIESGDAKLIIAGVPDQTGGNHNTELAVKNIPENVPVILMDHRPEAARENAKYNISLQLSGHTHGGQMPGVYELVRRANGGYVRGWYDVKGMKLFVSPGTSQWTGFQLRLFDPSEITLLILKSE
ncbi:MAG: metallophosphoesterase [Synergistaceae bacterium]|nr:metallophosphoesterase [Synergistaceae bacterium]